MKSYISLILGFLLMIIPTITCAEIEGYEVVSRNEKENITLYGKKMNGLYRGFKIDFKGGIYTRPFWNSTTSLTYAPQILYSDINKDRKKELTITLTTGHGSGLKWEEVHVFDTIENRLNINEVIVDNPLAIIYKNVKTKLSNEKAEIRVGDKEYEVDITPFEIKAENLFDDIGFGSIIDYEIINNNLMVRVSGQISPASYIGDIIITYEYRDKMYQEKTIDFITEINKNPFYGPVKNSVIFNWHIDWAFLLHDYIRNFQEHCIGFPNLLGILTELKNNNIKLALVLNGFRQFQNDNFKALHIEHLFDEVLISEWEGLRKTDKAIFNRALT